MWKEYQEEKEALERKEQMDDTMKMIEEHSVKETLAEPEEEGIEPVILAPVHFSTLRLVTICSVLTC
jgi:hypothetical protein